MNILFRKEMAAAANPEEVRQKRLKEFYDKYVNPLYSAGLQHVDDIIDPRRMRPVLIRALEMTRNKVDELPRKKHGITPVSWARMKYRLILILMDSKNPKNTLPN